jgi:hypothetical protein
MAVNDFAFGGSKERIAHVATYNEHPLAVLFCTVSFVAIGFAVGSMGKFPSGSPISIALMIAYVLLAMNILYSVFYFFYASFARYHRLAPNRSFVNAYNFFTYASLIALGVALGVYCLG